MERYKLFSWVQAILSFTGVAIAGTLYWAHRSGIDLPCTNGNGCDLVNASHWSQIGPVPVSFLGLCAYIVLLFSAVIKLTTEDSGLVKRLLVLILCISTLGTAFSWYLQYVAAVFIGAFCIYCRSSAIIMTLLFIASATEQMLRVLSNRSSIATT